MDLHVERAGNAVHCWIGACAALSEGDCYSWFALLGQEPHRELDAIVRTVNPRARCRPLHVADARVAWSVAIDPQAEPTPEPPEVALTKFSKGASFRFVPRRPLRP